MTEIDGLPAGYAEYLDEVKRDVLATQQRARRVLNSAGLILNWRIGCDILQRQELDGWGGSVAELARDLKHAFARPKGFSVQSPQYTRAFVQCWPILHRRVAELAVASYTYEQLLPEEPRALPAAGTITAALAAARPQREALDTGTEAAGE